MRHIGTVTDYEYWVAVRDQGKDPLDELRDVRKRPFRGGLYEMCRLAAYQSHRFYQNEVHVEVIDH